MSRELDARVAREVMGLVNGNIPYSTDMNAAMEVVAAVIAKLGGTIEVILEDGGWWVVFKVRPGCWHGWKDESLSRAICLAALEAVSPGTTLTTHKIDDFGTKLPE
jgi:hypothetical protein